MKNCGEDFQSEVFTKSFMDAMKTVVKVIINCIGKIHFHCGKLTWDMSITIVG